MRHETTSVRNRFFYVEEALVGPALLLQAKQVIITIIIPLYGKTLIITW